jgi:hypothetical protein
MPVVWRRRGQRPRVSRGVPATCPGWLGGTKQRPRRLKAGSTTGVYPMRRSRLRLSNSRSTLSAMDRFPLCMLSRLLLMNSRFCQISASSHSCCRSGARPVGGERIGHDRPRPEYVSRLRLRAKGIPRKSTLAAPSDSLQGCGQDVATKAKRPPAAGRLRIGEDSLSPHSRSGSARSRRSNRRTTPCAARCSPATGSYSQARHREKLSRPAF